MAELVKSKVCVRSGFATSYFTSCVQYSMRHFLFGAFRAAPQRFSSPPLLVEFSNLLFNPLITILLRIAE